MKHGKRPTRAQKMRIAAAGLNYENWRVVKATTAGLEVVHRHSGNVRFIPAETGRQFEKEEIK